MHASAGVHAGPKWKHAPEPLLVHVKYVAAPAWNAHVGEGQPTSRAATGPGGVGAAAEPAPAALPAPAPAGLVPPVRAGAPQPTRNNPLITAR